MRVLIIEDETAAARNLQSMLEHIEPEIEVVGITESIVDTIDWFAENETPDIVFMDIHIADGESFRIFDSIDIASPIIFTTAYDQYALEAFKVNSIDYLLKPLKEEELQRALDKWRRITNQERVEYHKRIDTMVAEQRKGNEMFLVHVKDKIVPLQASDVAYFYTANERVTAHLLNGGSYPIDKTLEALQSVLSEYDFFRANRQFIIARKAVKDISIWFGSRLSLNLTVDIPERIVISKARVPEFKRWLTDVRE
ncbi:MAG: response regulator transcription factor [Alistipes sp.]|nr:response regulator transcription factor [Alistipes sp.]MBQ7342448.1 response regulator transcription factor [Alistipes sp.]